jgi:SAM-dependent methyltransferase
LAESAPDDQRRASLERWDHVSAGWAKHADWVRDSSAPLAHRLIEALALQPGETVLELAAGPGDTGFLAAELVQPGGRLISSDQSEAMVEIARARAAQLGLSNVEHQVINAESIDLPVASVDAVICRWGLMLFVDPAAALAEMRRVLKPGGRVALAVWASRERNQWFVVPAQAAIRRGLAPAPNEGEPGPFALEDPARLTALLEGAGFVEVEIDEVVIDEGAATFEEFWERRLDMSLMGAAVRAAPTDVQRAFADEVRGQLRDFTGVSLAALAV